MAAAAASVTVLAAASSAHAARSPTLPPRVAALLDHLKNHPMTVTSQCMQYDAEPSTPLPDVARSLTPDDCRIAPGSRSRHADCIAGALLAAVGGLDAAHNIVTPLSWRSFTPYAGKPVACSPMEAADASYVHALIHRQEGSADGEFGSGFSNANFWHRTAAGVPGSAGDVLRAPLLENAKKLAVASGDKRLAEHVEGHVPTWTASRFVGLCAQAAQGGDAVLLRFCEGVMAEELRLFVDHCVRKQREQQAAGGRCGGSAASSATGA